MIVNILKNAPASIDKFFDFPKNPLYTQGKPYPTSAYLHTTERGFSKKFYLDLLQNDDVLQDFLNSFDGTMKYNCVFSVGNKDAIITPMMFKATLDQLLTDGDLDKNDAKIQQINKKIQYIASYANFVKSLGSLDLNTIDPMPKLTFNDVYTFFDEKTNYLDYSKQQNNTLVFRQKLYQLNMLCGELTNLSYYDVPKSIRQRIIQLSTYDFGNFENIPDILSPPEDMDIFNKDIVNPQLSKYIHSNMPPNLTDVQKALYVYFKLCEVLEYDESEFYGTTKDDKKLRNIGTINLITPQNNQVVCAEFCAIYAVLLHQMGFKPHVYAKQSFGECKIDKVFPFDRRHVFLKFSADQFLVEADSTPSILNGDLANVRFGGHNALRNDSTEEGLRCCNADGTTKVLFDQQVSIVQNLLSAERVKELQDIYKKTLICPSPQNVQKIDYARTKSIYQRLPQKHYPILFEQRVALLCKIAQSSNLHGLKLAQYLEMLKDKLFKPSEVHGDQRQVKFSFVRDNSVVNHPSTTVLLSYKNNSHGYSYFVLDGGKEPVALSRKQIEDNYKNSQFISLQPNTQPLDIQDVTPQK